MNILLVGSLNTIFLHSYKVMFEGMGYNVFIGNTSDVKFLDSDNEGFNFYPNKKNDANDSFRRIATKLNLDKLNIFWRIVEEREYRARLSFAQCEGVRGFLSKHNIDTIFFFWGTTLKKELICLDELKEKYKFNFKMILCVNTYPVRYILPKKVNKIGIHLLKRDLGYFNKFDSVLCPTKKMSNLLKNDLKIASNVYTKPDFLDFSFFNISDDIVRIKNSIVFLGNVDFEKRNLDDVSSIILKIANMGINVWVQSPCNLNHRNVHTFTPFTYSEISSGKLSLFIQQFTASIVIYNNYNNLRTSLGYPTRFALATLGGGYILLPKSTFDGIEDCLDVEQTKAIKSFESVKQLHQIVLELDTLDKPDFSKFFSNISESYLKEVLDN